MVLTDREIQVAIAQKQIVVEPIPIPDRYSSSSLDLTLGSHIRVWQKPQDGVLTVMCPGDPNYVYADVAKRYTNAKDICEEGYVMKPGDFILAWTVEDITLPAHSRLAARVEGKSSLARIGIGIHITAPTIHAGFSGNIQLEVFNLGPLQVCLVPGMPVCQLIFEQTMGTPEKGYKGQFFDQEAS